MTDHAKQLLREEMAKIKVKPQKRRLAPMSETAWQAMIDAIKSDKYPGNSYSPENISTNGIRR